MLMSRLVKMISLLLKHDHYSLLTNLFHILTQTPGGVLGISSDGDDQRIFWGFEIFDSGIFLGTKIWQVFFWVA